MTNETELERLLKARVAQLEEWLDEIDTADDMAKDNEKWYRARVRYFVGLARESRKETP